MVGVWDGDCWDLSQQCQTSSQHNPNRGCSIKLPSTAIKTALKVALYDLFDSPLAPLNGKFNEKVNHYNKKKERKIFDGTKRKISFGNH